MVPLGRGLFIHRGILLTIAVFFIVVSTSLLIQNVFAFEPESGDTSFSPGYLHTDDIPRHISLDMTFAPRYVEITFINQHVAGFTYAETIADAVYDLGINLGPNNVSHPPLDFVLSDDTEIEIFEVTRERFFDTVGIPYSSVTVLDDTREIGTTTVAQTGKLGEKKIMYESTYINGILDSTKPIWEETLVEPRDEIIALGTKRVFREMTIGGDTFSYWKKMTVKATSYHDGCDGCSIYTATKGVTLDKGVCATDWNVIPQGTEFYVPGYGFCHAWDRGGAVVGNVIDLGFLHADLLENPGQWSTRYVEIYILD